MGSLGVANVCTVMNVSKHLILILTMILDLQEHTVVFYALPMESNMYSIPAVFSITKTWFKIFSGPYITDMSLNLYPMLQISPAEP